MTENESSDAQRLQDVSELIGSGSLDEAIEDLLADGCQGAREIVVMGTARIREADEPRPSDEQLSAGLTNLVEWLERL